MDGGREEAREGGWMDGLNEMVYVDSDLHVRSHPGFLSHRTDKAVPWDPSFLGSPVVVQVSSVIPQTCSSDENLSSARRVM